MSIEAQTKIGDDGPIDVTEMCRVGIVRDNIVIQCGANKSHVDSVTNPYACDLGRVYEIRLL